MLKSVIFEKRNNNKVGMSIKRMVHKVLLILSNRCTQSVLVLGN